MSKDIKLLYTIEMSYDILKLFQYKNTSAWINIKNVLTNAMYDKNVRLKTGAKNEFLSLMGMRFTLFSLKHYIIAILSRQKKSLFLGASTGLFEHQKKTLDAYFPYYETEPEDVVYMLNCGNLRELSKHETYVRKNKIILENYLIVVLKKTLSKLVCLVMSKRKKESINAFVNELQKMGLPTSNKVLLQTYAEFITGYHLYTLFFKLLKIDTAYVVSAPTKSDMIAALKGLNIKTIDIQHGVIGKLHRGYNFNLSKNSALLPTVDQVNVYNQFWKDELINAGYFKSNMINIVGRLKYDIVQDNIRDLDFTYIIFTGQGAFFEQIIAFFQKSDLFLSKKNIKLFYKAHPRELESEVENFKEKIHSLQSCYFYEGPHTTEELIKNSSAHISVFSSCHFDAVYFNQKTYVLDIMEENIMNYYVQNAPSHFIRVQTIQETI